MTSPLGEVDSGVDERFHVHLKNFEGPFDLLLQLIGKHKLDITEVALSQVTDEFIAHIRARGSDWDLDQTSRFLMVAATLLDLKAARLLPRAEVEDEADLALLEARDLLFARLLQYRAYKQAASWLAERYAEGARRFPRTAGPDPQFRDAMPEVVIGKSPEEFALLAVQAMLPKAPPVISIEHIHASPIDMRAELVTVSDHLRRVGSTTFRALVADCTDTLEKVARFLVLLELYREAAVGFDQVDPLGELSIRWVGGERAEALLAGRIALDDETGRAPQPETQSQPQPSSASPQEGER